MRFRGIILQYVLDCSGGTSMKKKIALFSALTLISLASCSNKAASSQPSDTSSEISASEQEISETENISDTSAQADENGSSAKDPDKFNTYPMDELYGENSPLSGYWHTNGKDMYIEYNEFGNEGFTIFILGENMQIFSSQVGTFSGTPQNTDYILASSEDDAEVANLFNRSTKFNMAVNDDNTISVFLDFGYSNTSTYTFEKTNQPAEAMMPYCGSWGDAKGTQLGFTYSESKNMTEFSTLFGFSPDQYPVGIPSVTDDNECWICCPFKKSVLTSFSDQGVYYDVINIHMEFNSDGTVNVGRVYTNPNLINSGISNTGLVLQKLSD